MSRKHPQIGSSPTRPSIYRSAGRATRFPMVNPRVVDRACSANLRLTNAREVEVAPTPSTCALGFRSARLRLSGEPPVALPAGTPDCRWSNVSSKYGRSGGTRGPGGGTTARTGAVRLLDALPRQKVPNARLVEVAQARSRQLAHEQAELFADLVEITHAVAVADLPADKPGDRAEAVARAAKRVEWAAHEIAAGLTWTPHRRRPGTRVRHRPGRAPAAGARSLRHGDIDRGKAGVFVEYLDPANGGR